MLNSNMELTLKQRGFKVSFMLESSILHKGICFWSFEANSNPIPHMHCNLVTLAGQQLADTGAI